MQEHGGKDVGIGLNRGVYKIIRHQAVIDKQRVDLAGIGKLPEKDEDIPSDQYQGEQGEMFRWIFVVKRDHRLFLSGCRGGYDRLWSNS